MFRGFFIPKNMILIDKTQVDPFANKVFTLRPTLIDPKFLIELENKITNVITISPLTDSSTVNYIQVFNFDLVGIETLENGNYNYKLYEGTSITGIDSDSKLLEIGLMQILGSGNCITADIAYNDDNDSDDVMYYACTN
jgi:hypothetical protein